MAVLRAYFDVSYSGRTDVTAIGGYIGTDDQWQHAEEAWKDGLAYWGLDDFNLSDLPRIMGHEKSGLCAGYFARIIWESKY
jgi:hypothetical protein